MNPCDELPSAAHQLLLSLQRRQRVGRPFVLDLSALALDAEVDEETAREEISGLLDLSVLSLTGDRYVLRATCPHRANQIQLEMGRFIKC